MANYLIEEDQNTYVSRTISAPEQENRLLRFLTKYKLPTQPFMENGIEWSDLQNLNDIYFKGFCDDLQLNTVQMIRFKKLIKEINQQNASKTNNEFKQTIDHKIKIVTDQITESFDRMNIELSHRKQELLSQLEKLRQNKLETLQNIQMHEIHIQYICDEAAFKHNIECFGAIDDTPDYLKSPIISCTAEANCIRIDIKNENKYPFFVEIIEKVSNSSWSIMQNKNIIQNIKPFTTYLLRARFQITSHLFSSYSKEVEVRTPLDLKWNLSQHIKTKHVELMNPYKLCCDSKCGTMSVVAHPVLSRVALKSVAFEFIFEEFCQTSMFGLISAPIEETMNGYWKHKVIAMNKYGYILETMDGLSTVHRYARGIDTEKSMFSNPGISLPNVIKTGDRFIFRIDFDTRQCTVYFCECHESRKVVTKSNVATWENIPNKVMPVYGHSVGSRFIQKQSIVSIKVLSFVSR